MTPPSCTEVLFYERLVYKDIELEKIDVDQLPSEVDTTYV